MFDRDEQDVVHMNDMFYGTPINNMRVNRIFSILGDNNYLAIIDVDDDNDIEFVSQGFCSAIGLMRLQSPLKVIFIVTPRILNLVLRDVSKFSLLLDHVFTTPLLSALKAPNNLLKYFFIHYLSLVFF